MVVGDDAVARSWASSVTHEADIMDAEEDTTDTATPCQLNRLPPVLDKVEAEDEVLSREKTNDGVEDRGVISDVTRDGTKETGKGTVKII